MAAAIPHCTATAILCLKWCADRGSRVVSAMQRPRFLMKRIELYTYCCKTYMYLKSFLHAGATRPKIESRFEDVNVLDTVRNYSIGTFIWGSPIVFFVWGLPYSSNRHVTPVSVRGRKGLTCSIRAPPCPRFDTLRRSVSNRAQLFLAV